MKTFLLLAGAIAIASGCASRGPATAWAKPGVSKIDYGTDLGMCTGYASMANAGNGAHTAGGISGQNTGTMGTSTEDQQRAEANRPPSPVSGPQNNAGGNSGAAFPTGSGAYRDSASSDMVQRAATQQRTQEMARQRARQMALSSCLTQRGYTEIRLTPAQRAELGKLDQGSKEYLEFLYKLGADPAVIQARGAAGAGS